MPETRAHRPETLAVHAGYSPDETRSVAVPIHQTVAYAFDDAQHGADLFNLVVPGNIYTRIMNPTQDVLEQRMAALEGGVASLATASGSAAVTYAVLTLARAGDNVVTIPRLYGGTYTLFRHMLPDLGIEVRFADDDSADAVAKLIDDRTKAVYCESIGNPAGNVVDLEALATAAHDHGVPLLVDSTVATPAVLRPIEHGADVVIHSLTKYIGGHGTTVGGVIVDGGTFDWTAQAERFPQLTQPEPAYHDVVYTEALGAAAFVGRARTVALRNTGAAISPFNAWQILQGLETLHLRMERHRSNALAVAQHLEAHPKVSWVRYGGLESSPYFELSNKYCDGTPSALLSFGIEGGYEAGVRFYDALDLFTRLVNIGDTKSLAAHPASTTHRQLAPEELVAAGVTEDQIRLCVGIEHLDDILADLDQALEVAAA